MQLVSCVCLMHLAFIEEKKTSTDDLGQSNLFNRSLQFSSCLSSCSLQISKITASVHESDDSLQNFFGIWKDETFWQEESIVAIVSVTAHLEGVADRDFVFTQSVVNANARCSILNNFF